MKHFCGTGAEGTGTVSVEVQYGYKEMLISEEASLADTSFSARSFIC